jgi:FMN-dependent NADH-azoreductase
MARLLRIDASSRTQGSHSREMADFFENQWLAQGTSNEVVVRDLVKNPIPHIEATTITGFYTPKEQQDETLKAALALSDELIQELFSADVLLISTPMYNFSIPSALKAYIDQIIRIGYTFSFDEAGFTGLVTGKKAYVITAAGAVYSNPALAGLNFLEPYLKTLLNFLGITTTEFIPLEGTTIDENAFANSKQAAMNKISTLIASKTVISK